MGDFFAVLRFRIDVAESAELRERGVELGRRDAESGAEGARLTGGCGNLELGDLGAELEQDAVQIGLDCVEAAGG